MMLASNILPALFRHAPRAGLLPFVLCLLPLIVGCTSAAQRQANEAVTRFYFGDYRRSVELLKPLSQKTDQDFVLNNLRLGAAALAEYDLDTAEAAFLRAYEVLNSYGVNDGGRTLGAVLVDEKIKIWRGEPFERAMANFYLGLVYYMQQDYGNARGAFENALFKLKDYEKEAPADGGVDPDRYEAVQTNFALGYLMLGKAYQRLGKGDLARANFDQAAKLRRYLRDVADFDRNADSNVLLVVDYGAAPQKVTTSDGAVVGFAPAPMEVGPVALPEVEVDRRPYDVDGTNRPLVDLVQLAQDRRWQSIDTIRAVKSGIGTGLIAGGAGYGVYRSGQRGGMSNEDAAVTLGLIGAGLLMKATSQADVRQWEMLPRAVFVIPLKLPPGKHSVTVRFPDARGLQQTWVDLDAPEQGEAAYYFHMQRGERGERTWPPAPMAEAR
jgi:tetratricopeptide (TPR) repeat protein